MGIGIGHWDSALGFEIRIGIVDYDEEDGDDDGDDRDDVDDDDQILTIITNHLFHRQQHSYSHLTAGND